MRNFSGNTFYTGISDEEQKELVEKFYEKMVEEVATYSEFGLTSRSNP